MKGSSSIPLHQLVLVVVLHGDDLSLVAADLPLLAVSPLTFVPKGLFMANTHLEQCKQRVFI